MRTLAVAFIVIGSLAGGANAQTIFTDDFTSGPDAQWGNEVGNWQEVGGEYHAQSPSTLPNASSSLPFVLSDFMFTADISGIDDGGLWLRSSSTADAIGREGVLVVLVGANVYFHNVSGGSYGSILGSVAHGLGSGGSGTVTVSAIGDDYSVFIDGSASAVTTLNTSDHTTGQIALYDNGNQSFDNVVLATVPEPSSALLLGLGTLGFVLGRRRKRQLRPVRRSSQSVGGRAAFPGSQVS